MKGIVWIASYPKSGNTWFLVFLMNLLADRADPVELDAIDVPSFADRATFDRALGWESSDLTRAEILGARAAAQARLARKDGAMLKTHDAFAHPTSRAPLFAAGASRAALYFVRNPLDVAVSAAHQFGVNIDQAIAHMNRPAFAIGRWKDALEVLLPQPLGTWSWHVRSWTDQTEVPVHVLRYEDMAGRPLETFAAACRFAGLPAEPGRVARALEHARFERLQMEERRGGFRMAPPGRAFFRAGKVGSWRTTLTALQVDTIVAQHGEAMRRFGYLGPDGSPWSAEGGGAG